MFGDRARCGRAGGVEVTPGGQQHASATGADGHHPRAALPLAVYVGRIRQTGIDALKSIGAANVAEVRYLDPTAAQNQFGFVATGGALVIKLYETPKNPEGGA